MQYDLFLFLLHNFHWLSDELLPKCCHEIIIAKSIENAKSYYLYRFIYLLLILFACLPYFLVPKKLFDV